MKPSWEFFSKRRGISLEELIRSGLTTFENLEKYCNQRGVECPTRETFQETYDSIYIVKPAVLLPPKKVESPKKPVAAPKKPATKKPAPKKPAVRKTRRKKAGT